MGKLKDQFNRLMRPAAGKQNKATDDRSVISASKSLTDSAASHAFPQQEVQVCHPQAVSFVHETDSAL